jgi:hypothetical protein
MSATNGRYAYLTVTHVDTAPQLHADTIEIDASGLSWDALRAEAGRRLRDYSRVKLVSAVLTQWGDQAIPGSAHPSGRIPMSYCFQPDELDSARA